ncbi:hypothetical protein ABIE12_000234 [Serratia sp. 509]
MNLVIANLGIMATKLQALAGELIRKVLPTYAFRSSRASFIEQKPVFTTGEGRHADE